MPSGQYRIVERYLRDAQAERRALAAGLLATPAVIAPKYFYDTLGCALFGAICELPEYYPTRTERAIFNEHRDAIARALGQGKQFVDLGAGDCCKALAWLAFVAPSRYIAVDFAGDEIARSLARMAPDFPEVEMLGVVADFTRGLDLGRDLTRDAVTFFYPGSSIGNFTPGEAREFLTSVHLHCVGREGSGLLIGVDTKKDPRRLTAAYDDAVGVTAAFNRNVLHHVNSILGSDFRPDAFDHVALYDEGEGRIEMHLAARTVQTVKLPGATRTFAAGERIHTENSYKYAPEEFTMLLQEAGFRRVRRWQDGNGDFAVFYAT
ncbi:MAG: L-histidine N(alpha)-methyltransferase [Burkholderiales bacterium]|nr:L-histidine N(alpha)-methyltransferase [Burkholderiales bacterium]